MDKLNELKATEKSIIEKSREVKDEMEEKLQAEADAALKIKELDEKEKEIEEKTQKMEEDLAEIRESKKHKEEMKKMEKSYQRLKDRLSTEYEKLEKAYRLRKKVENLDTPVPDADSFFEDKKHHTKHHKKKDDDNDDSLDKPLKPPAQSGEANMQDISSMIKETFDAIKTKKFQKANSNITKILDRYHSIPSTNIRKKEIYYDILELRNELKLALLR
jgi:chromosome segregation ATPase